MNERDIKGWVEHELSELYWKFRDDVDDNGGERIGEELDYIKPILVKIINEHKTVD